MKQSRETHYSASTTPRAITRSMDTTASTYTVELTSDEFYHVHDLLSNGISLHAQRGKKQIAGEQSLIHAEQVVEEEGRYLISCSVPFDSIGLQCDTLPPDILICDVDKPGFTAALWSAFASGDYPRTLIEQTPRGGLHIWGRHQGLRPTTGQAMSTCGIPYEIFSRSKQITIHGPGRTRLMEVLLSEVPFLPEILQPARRPLPKYCELPCPIPEGSRYTTLTRLVTGNPLMTSGAIKFICQWVCQPAWGLRETSDMIDYSSRCHSQARVGEPLETRDPTRLSLEARVLRILHPLTQELWIFRLPVGQWYHYDVVTKCWRRTGTTDYELDDFIRAQADLLVESSDFDSHDTTRLSTKRFRETLRLGLESFCYCEPQRQLGLAFRNGRPLISADGEVRIEMPGVRDYCFASSPFSVSLEQPLGPGFRKFLLELTDGSLLKINVLRAFLGLLALGNTQQQVALYLVGPGGSGKSTLSNLLLKIAGAAGTSMTLNRLGNRFELIKLLDKTLVVLPDIPSGRVGHVICSILKRAIGGEIIQGEVKNGELVDIEPTGIWLITSNRVWKPEDMSGGFERRIIYLETPRATPEYDLGLPAQLEAEAGSLISWALSMPIPLMNLSNRANLLNASLGGSGYDADALVTWMTTTLYAAENQSERVGAKWPSPPAGSLYESYSSFATTRGAEPIEPYQFGATLVDRLLTWGYSGTQTRRRNTGNHIFGISFNPLHGAQVRPSGSSAGLGGLDSVAPWASFKADLQGYYDQERVRKAGLYGPPAGLSPQAGQLESREHQVSLCEEEQVDLDMKVQVQAGGQMSNAHPGEVHLDHEELAHSVILELHLDSESNAAELSLVLEGWLKGSDEPFMPAELVKSTTLEGIPYPLAASVKQSLKDLCKVPLKFQPVVDLLNRHSACITEAAYQACKRMLPEDKYYQRKSPIRLLWPQQYGQRENYGRLIPANGDSHNASILNLKKACRQVVLGVYQRAILPPDWGLLEFDMAACHTAIFLGLMGLERAPHTWECYQTGHFWKTVRDRYGAELPKDNLKTLFYCGLNGGLINSPKAIVKHLTSKGTELRLDCPLDQAVEAAQKHPILQELVHFQQELLRLGSLHLPHVPEVYSGTADEIRMRTKASRYNTGLLTSRTLASHEVILLGYLVDMLVTTRLAIPVSFEHDGLLILYHKSDHDRLVHVMETTLGTRSLTLCGVQIYGSLKEWTERD